MRRHGGDSPIAGVTKTAASVTSEQKMTAYRVAAFVREWIGRSSSLRAAQESPPGLTPERLLRGVTE